MFQGTALAKRPGQPYPATFRCLFQWTHRELNPPGSRRAEETGPACRAGVVPLDHEPVRCQWTAGESNPDFRLAEPASSRWTSSPFRSVDLMGVEPTPSTLQGSIASSGMQAHSSFFKRSVRELNPAFRLTKAVCSRNTYRPNQ